MTPSLCLTEINSTNRGHKFVLLLVFITIILLNKLCVNDYAKCLSTWLKWYNFSFSAIFFSHPKIYKNILSKNVKSSVSSCISTHIKVKHISIPFPTFADVLAGVLAWKRNRLCVTLLFPHLGIQGYGWKLGYRVT